MEHIQLIIAGFQLIGIIITPIIFIMIMKGDVRVIKTEMKAMSASIVTLNTSFSQIADVLKQLAVQSVRISHAEEDIRELRRGKGWIIDDKENVGLNREYKG